LPQKTTWRKNTLQHIKSVLSGIFTFAKNEGVFDGANPVQGALLPSRAREAKETFAYNLNQILQILDVLPLLPKAYRRDGLVCRAARRRTAGSRMAGLQRHRNYGLPINMEIGRQSAEDHGQPQFRTGNSCIGRDSGRVPHEHA
jgi:hypothetical protein